MFDKIYYRIPLIFNDNERFVTLKGYKTINVILSELFPIDRDNYEMKLIIANQLNVPNNGIGLAIRIEPTRTLNSYRIKEGDKLLITKIVAQTGIWQSLAGNSDLVVVINCPNNGISKTMKFPPEIDIRTLKHIFIFKVKLYVAPILYGIYTEDQLINNNIHNNNNMHNNSNGGPQLSSCNNNHYLNDADSSAQIEEHVILSSLALRTPARLTCKFVARKPLKLFGVDPMTLPRVEDWGCEVPEVLVVLKQLLEVQDGLITEGIFRKAGSEIEMKFIREKLENGENVIGMNVHSIATMIKRWFKELPQRILATNIHQIVQSKETKLNVYSFLSPFYASLLLWLFRLISIPVRHHQSTLMDTKNIGFTFFLFDILIINNYPIFQ